MFVLTKNLINLKTGYAVKKVNKNRQPVSYHESKKIGIVFSVEDKVKHENIKKLVKQLELDNKEVDVLSYLSKDKQNHEFKFDFFTDQDISFWGNFKSDNVISFINKPFDYLFHVDTYPNILIENILAKSAAKCRIGNFYGNKNDYYEMMIKLSDQNDISELTNQMYHYTKSIMQ